MEENKSEFKIFDTNEYEAVMKTHGPEGRNHYVIHNKTNERYGLLYNKKTTNDQGYYAPYLMYIIGRKCGINVPETELGIYLINDVDQLVTSYKDSFFESSLVYTEIYAYSDIMNRASHASLKDVKDLYLEDNPQKREQLENSKTVNFEDYVEANVYYLISNGSKPKQEYSKSEIEAIRQELVDRAMFGLKLGIQGQTSINLYDNKNAKLSPYYLSSYNMLLLGINDDFVSSTLEYPDDKFKDMLDYELKTQYGISHNSESPTSEQLLKHIFETYPKQAEKAYKKVISFSAQDLKSELDSYTRLDDLHKKMAIRIFEAREKEFQKVYKEQNRDKNLDD